MIELLFLFNLLFLIGLFGIIVNKKNFLFTLLSIELMYLGIIASTIVIALMQINLTIHIYALCFLIIAACESAIGLGILIVLYRYGQTLQLQSYQYLHG